MLRTIHSFRHVLHTTPSTFRNPDKTGNRPALREGAVDMSGQALPLPDISVEQQTDELLDKFDANRDGKIDLSEFMDQVG